MGSQPTEIIFVDIKNETNAAYLIDAGDGNKIWIPKSEIENDLDVEQNIRQNKYNGIEMELPEWLLKKKDLI